MGVRAAATERGNPGAYIVHRYNHIEYDKSSDSLNINDIISLHFMVPEMSQILSTGGDSNFFSACM